MDTCVAKACGARLAHAANTGGGRAEDLRTEATAMTRLPRQRCGPVLIVGLLAAAGCGGRRADGDGVSLTRSALTGAVTITINTPKTVPLTSVSLGAEGSILTGSSTIVERPPSAGRSVITNMATASVTNLGSSSVVGEVWSASAVLLGSGARVLGQVHAQDVVVGPQAQIVGGIDRATPLVPPTVTSWTVVFTGTPRDVNLTSGKSTQNPGRYGTLRVAGGAELTLNAGAYFIDTLRLDANSKLVLNQDAGPVLLYVGNSLQWRASVRSTRNTPPDLLLVYLGSPGVTIDVAFNGFIVAPNAQLTLATVTGGHTGAFFAKHISTGAGVKITYRPPHAILRAATPPPGKCMEAIVPRSDLTGRAREIQFQEDILRYCISPESGRCDAAVRARANVDYFTAAAALVREAMSPAAYIALVRDRERKLADLLVNETTACTVVGTDPDGDFVPTSRDACPNTPELTPTLANGCTDTSLPPAPSATDVKNSLGYVGVGSDPRCVDAPSPIIPAPLGAWRFPPDPTVGKAIWVARDPDTSGCPIFYDIQVELTDGAGVRSVVVRPTEDVVLPWITKPPGAIQINLRTSDPGDRGAWASYAVFTHRYRARAVNGGGRRSPWSEWFLPGREDCVAGGPCQD
jgi:hypothetical protein